MTQVADREASIGDLIGSLATSTASLIKQEVHLAKTEMTKKTTTAAKAVGLVGLGGAVLHMGLLALAASLVVGLAAYVPMWISALGLGAVLAVVGAALLVTGLGTLRHLDPAPRKTIKTLKDDASWAKEQVR